MSAIIRFAWGEQDEHCGRHDDVENDHDDQTRSTKPMAKAPPRMLISYRAPAILASWRVEASLAVSITSLASWSG